MTKSVDAERPASAEELAGDSHTLNQRIHEILHKQPALSPIIVLILACIVFSFLSSNFLTLNNFSQIIQQVAVVGTLAVGQTVIILTAGIDLSIGFAMALSTLVMTKMVADHHANLIVALLLGGIVALACGLLNGFLVTRIKLPPFIVTLGTFGIFTAVTLIYAQGQTIQLNPASELTWTGHQISIGSLTLTYGVLIMVALYIVVAFALRYTAWGRHLYATGDDVDAARLAGIRTDRVILSAYLLAGFAVAVGAWVQIGRTQVGDPNGGLNLNLQTITAVVIGGTSLFGGRGLVIGSLIGAFIVQVFNSGLFLAGYNPQYQVLATGALVIIAVSVDQWIRKVKA